MIFKATEMQKLNVRSRASYWVDAFDSASQMHGLQTGRSPLHIRAEVRRSVHFIMTRHFVLRRASMVFATLGMIDGILAFAQVYSKIWEMFSMPIPRSRHDADTPLLGWIFITAAYVCLFAYQSQRKIYTTLRWDRAAARRRVANTIPALCAVLLAETAHALHASIPHREVSYARAEKAATRLAKALPRGGVNYTSFRTGSRRRKEVKEHTALVAAAIERSAAEIYANPATALRELAEMAHTITARCADCRPGALLDDWQLAGLTPVRTREVLRLLTASTLTVGAAVGIGFLNPPASVTPLLIGGIGLTFFSLVYGHNNPRSLELLDYVRGIQRP